jgi:hypothetical protein
MTAIRPVISSSDTASTTITETAVSLIPRHTSIHTSTHEIRAMGSQSAAELMPA